jgi:membrane carboxypeptidase/penicillin-binding protein
MLILPALAALLAAYLLVVAWWAAAALGEALASLPYSGANPLSPAQTAILLGVEDPTFFEHPGLSLAKGQGLATVTSAVARDVLLLDGRISGRKGRLQAFYRAVFKCCKRIDLGRDVMALVLNARLQKSSQLALYTNSVYMGTHEGEQVRGLARAATLYLGKPLAETSDAEFIGLVAMIKAPNTYHPQRQPQLHGERARRIAAMLAGRCAPSGWFDTDLDTCK